MKTYTVTVAQTLYMYQNVTVTAMTEEEAEQIAMELTENSDNWKMADQETFVNGITSKE